MTIPAQMKAAVYRGKDDVRAETVPVPQIGRGELLVRVESCGLCGTDLKKIQYATVPPPRIFGHEIAGIVAQVGAGVKKYRVGDRIVVFHHIACLRCEYCRNDQFTLCKQFEATGTTAGFEPSGGGYAQYIRVLPWVLRDGGIVKIPKNITYDEACMLEPLNTVLRAVNKLELKRGQSVIVFGQGSIGLMFTQLCKLRGTRVIGADLLDARLQAAKKFGASATVNASAEDFKQQVRALTKTRGANAAIVAVPSGRAIEQAIASTCAGGKVLLFAHTRRGDAVPMDAGAICVDERHIMGSYSSSPHLMKECARLIFQRRINVRGLVTHRFPIEEIDTAVRLASNPAENSLKIVINPFLYR